MNHNIFYKLNSIMGFSDENIEKIIDFSIRISRLKIKLTQDEKNLCQLMGIDEQLAVLLKSDKNSKIKKLPQCNYYGKMDFDGNADGICVLHPTKTDFFMDDIYRVLYRNKLKYLEKGFNLFCFETEKHGEYYLALAKEKTDSDILKWRRTDGVNHDIDNVALIDKIEEWKQKYDLLLWACGGNWLQIFFIHEAPKHNGQFGGVDEKFNRKFKLWDKRTPKYDKFAKEVIEFCPDIITQVYRNKTVLIQEMKRINGVYLWWD